MEAANTTATATLAVRFARARLTRAHDKRDGRRWLMDIPLRLEAMTTAPSPRVPAGTGRGAIPTLRGIIRCGPLALAELDVKSQEVVHPGRPGESSGCQVITLCEQEAWMNVHKNARLTPRRRQELVTRLEGGHPVKLLAREFGVAPRTVRKWRGRYRD